MNYYYALLESYELLKKRKFHLSILTEDEKKEVVGDGESGKKDMPPEANAAFLAAVDATTAPDPTKEDLVFVKAAEGGGKITSHSGPFLGNPMAAVTSFKELSSRQWNQVACHFTPDCNQDDKDQRSGRQIKRDQVSADEVLKKKTGNILGKLSALWKNAVGVFAPDEDSEKSSVEKAQYSIWGAILDPERDTVELSRGKDIKEIESRITNDDRNEPEQLKHKMKAIKSFGEVLDFYKKFVETYEGKIPTGKDKDAVKFRKKLRTLIEGEAGIPVIHVGSRGLKIKDLYVSFNDARVAKNHPYNRMIMQLQSGIEAFNANNIGNTEESSFEDISGTDRKRPGGGGGGGLYSIRGVVSEIYATISPQVLKLDRIQTQLKAKDLTASDKTKLEAELKDVLSKIEKGVSSANTKSTRKDDLRSVSEKIMTMFGLGLKTEGYENLPTEDDVDAALAIEAIRAWFKNPDNKNGLSDAAVDALIEKGGHQLGMGVLLMVMATRHFDKQLYGDLEVIDTEHDATVDSDIFGVKSDIISHVKCKCDKKSAGPDCSHVATHFNKIMAGTNNKFDLKKYEIDSENCSVAVPIELKTHNDSGNDLTIGLGANKHFKQAIDTLNTTHIKPKNPNKVVLAQRETIRAKPDSPQRTRDLVAVEKAEKVEADNQKAYARKIREQKFVREIISPLQATLGKKNTLVETVKEFDKYFADRLQWQDSPSIEIHNAAITGWANLTGHMAAPKDIKGHQWSTLSGFSRVQIANYAKAQVKAEEAGTVENRSYEDEKRDKEALRYISTHFARTGFVTSLLGMDHTGDEPQKPLPKVQTRDDRGRKIWTTHELGLKATQVIAAKIAICVGTESSTLRNNRNLTDSEQGLYENNDNVEDITKGLVSVPPKYKITLTGSTMTVRSAAENDDENNAAILRVIVGHAGLSVTKAASDVPKMAGTEDSQESDVGTQSAARKNIASTDMGEGLHKQWQENRRKSNPDEATRIKKTKDAAWAEENGTDEVDILNTDFADLPEDWQGENLAAATAAVDAVDSSETEDEAASIVHDQWMARNSWEKDSQPELFVPYDELSDEEKEKDLVHVEDAAKRLGKKFKKSTEESKDIFMEFLQNQFTMLGTLLNS